MLNSIVSFNQFDFGSRSGFASHGSFTVTHHIGFVVDIQLDVHDNFEEYHNIETLQILTTCGLKKVVINHMMSCYDFHNKKNACTCALRHVKILLNHEN